MKPDEFGWRVHTAMLLVRDDTRQGYAALFSLLAEARESDPAQVPFVLSSICTVADLESVSGSGLADDVLLALADELVITRPTEFAVEKALRLSSKLRDHGRERRYRALLGDIRQAIEALVDKHVARQVQQDD